MTESERSDLNASKRGTRLARANPPKPRLASTMRKQLKLNNSSVDFGSQILKDNSTKSEPQPAMEGTAETGLRERQTSLGR